MNDTEINQCMELHQKLWPRAAKELNSEQLNVWWMVLNKHPRERVEGIMRHWAATSKYPAKPADIQQSLQKMRSEFVVSQPQNPPTCRFKIGDPIRFVSKNGDRDQPDEWEGGVVKDFDHHWIYITGQRYAFACRHSDITDEVRA